MFEIDPRSLNFTAGLMTLVMGFVMMGQARGYPKAIRGVYLWGAAPPLWTVASIAYALTGQIPELVIVSAGNASLLAGHILLLLGTARFYDEEFNWRAWVAAWAACISSLMLFLVLWPDYRARLLIFSIFVAAAMGTHARILERNGRGFAARFVRDVLNFLVIAVGARGCATFWLDTPQSHRFEPSWLQATYLASYSIGGMSIVVGLVLMASERARAEFEHLATHDSLTGALTRRALLSAADEALGSWKRYRRPVSFLLMDVDHFKRVNDVHGHMVGDRVLIEFARAVRSELREVDLFGRFGGEEFVVVMPETSHAGAQSAANRIRTAVSHFTAQGGTPRCTVSIGLTAALPADSSLDAILSRADAALYRAKTSGRDRVEEG